MSDEVIINAIVTIPRVLRQMPQLLREAGLELVTSFVYVVPDVERADFWYTSIKSLVKRLPKAGAMSESQASEWPDAMSRRSDQGTFSEACYYYGYVAAKP